MAVHGSSARDRLLDPGRNTPHPRQRINVVSGPSADMSGIVLLLTSSAERTGTGMAAAANTGGRLAGGKSPPVMPKSGVPGT
jgi:hypothetical protein